MWFPRLRAGGKPRYKSPMANPVIALINLVLDLYWWVVVIAVIVSWLIAFNVINTYNNFVRSLLRALEALTEPVFRRIRKVIPPIGGLDLSPLVVLVVIWFIQYTLAWASSRYGV
jgi:YggT family protein